MEKFFALDKEKQATIINAALQCFAKFGYNKASVNDIAVAADISKASVFQYFGNKKKLYAYLLEYSEKIITESFHHGEFGEKSDLFDRVLTSSIMEAESLKKHPYISQFIASAWTEKSADVKDTLQDFMSETNKYRNDLVLRKDDISKFKNPNDAETVFQILMLMAEGYAARCRNEENMAYDTLIKEFQKMVEAMRRNFYKEEYIL